MEGNLKDFQEKWHIKRLNFNEISPTELEEQNGTDKLICPYCKKEISYTSMDNLY